MRSKSILTFIGILQVITYRLPLSESAECREGLTCISLEDCNEAKMLVMVGGDPERCGFEGDMPKVCCSNPSGSIAERKCLKYLGVTARSVFMAKTARTTNTTRFIVRKPGHEEKFIIKGVRASPNEFPHMALLGYTIGENIGWHCGGSLISEKFVLTAAHCLMTKYGNVTKIRLGVHNISSWTSDIQEFRVKEFYRHPNYKSISRYDDIGLIELDHPANIDGRGVKPACLYTFDKFYTKSTIATGWGFTKPNGSPSDVLMQALLFYESDELCARAYEKQAKLLNGIDAATQFCAEDKSRDTCEGDSGGPLQISFKGWRYSITGITSFGRHCAGPSVYTRVSYYVPWIESIVWPEAAK